VLLLLGCRNRWRRRRRLGLPVTLLPLLLLVVVVVVVVVMQEWGTVLGGFRRNKSSSRLYRLMLYLHLLEIKMGVKELREQLLLGPLLVLLLLLLVVVVKAVLLGQERQGGHQVRKLRGQGQEGLSIFNMQGLVSGHWGLGDGEYKIEVQGSS
jgi:hypothetical protein